MKKSDFDKMMTAARDIAAQPDLSTLDPFTLQWARDLIAFNPVRPYLSPLQDKVCALWDDDPMGSLTSLDIQQRLRMSADKVHTTLHSMVYRSGRLFHIRTGRSGLYFVNPQARDAALEAHKKTPKPLRIPRIKGHPPKELRMAARVKPTIDLARRETTPFNPADELLGPGAIARSRAVKAPQGPAVVPPGLKVQRCVSSADTRYTPTLPPGGGEFSRQWEIARQRGHLRDEEGTTS